MEEHGGPLAQGEVAIGATTELNHREQGGHVCQDTYIQGWDGSSL